MGNPLRRTGSGLGRYWLVTGTGVVVMPVDPHRETQRRRNLAARARRLAGGLLLESDRAQLNRYAEQLEQEAAQLEAEGLSPTPSKAVPAVSAPQQQQVQQQQQQQQQSSEETDSEETKS